MTPGSRISVLVIDDSAHNRRAITQLLESAPDIQVLDRASDGHEGLRKAATLRPDVITLDLEMPKLDGFGFLRLLMATVPTPVIVLSSYAHRTDVFKALQLGAIDFIAKPRHPGKIELESLRAELLDKVRAVSSARAPVAPQPVSPMFVIGVGASTGGPAAVQRLVEALSGEPTICMLICQHMPPKFTLAFAERLDRIGSFTVSEACDGDILAPGRVFIAPGGRQMEMGAREKRLELRTPSPQPSDKHAPSVDRLFQSIARTLGDQSMAVVLTGMGADGAEGARAIQRVGGRVWCESEASAVIPGMPRAAIQSGAVERVLALAELGPALAQLAHAADPKRRVR